MDWMEVHSSIAITMRSGTADGACRHSKTVFSTRDPLIEPIVFLDSVPQQWVKRCNVLFTKVCLFWQFC
jgi:hypothetical protein